MATKAFIEGTIEGTGKFHRTSIFPCCIFQCATGVNRKEGDPNYDLFKLALKATATRLYPNYCNLDWSTDVSAYNTDREERKKFIDSLSSFEKTALVKRISENPKLGIFLMIDVVDGALSVNMEKKPFEISSTMGCRTYNGLDINGLESFKLNIKQVITNGELYDDVTSSAAKDGRGNLAPTTIILPTIAMEADRDVEKFMKLLDKKIHEAKDMLLERFDWMCSQPDKSAKFMWENKTFHGYHPEEGIRSALKHGTLVIGQLGMAEALQLLIGKDHTDGAILNKEDIINGMIEKLKKSEKRDLTKEELEQIRNFVMSEQ